MEVPSSCAWQARNCDYPVPLHDEFDAAGPISSQFVHATISRDVRYDAFGFASFRLFSVGIACVGYYVQHLSPTTYRRLRAFGHGQQAAIVGGFRRDLLGVSGTIVFHSVA